MTTPMTRPLADNRLLRAVGGPSVSVSLGTSLGAVFDTPMMTGLAASEFKRAAASDPRTLEERQQSTEDEFQRRKRIGGLEAQLQWTSDEAERADIRRQLDEIQREREAQISSQTQQALDDGRLASPEDLAEKYGELGLQFDRPMTPEEAKLLADGKRAETIREALISKGPQGVIPTAAKFGAGLAAMATDPLEVASAFIPVVGQAGKAAAIARFGRIGGRAAVGATEGLVGAALTEPIYYGLSRSQQLDYSMSEALLNIGLGAAFGGAIGTAAGAVSRAEPSVSAGARVEPLQLEKPRLAIEYQREAADIALRQFTNGEVIDLGRLLDGTDLRASTTLSRTNGIEFQANQALPENVSRDIRPSYLAPSRDGTPLRFDTVQKADAFAARNGGEVVQSDGGFAVRQVAGGDFVRTPYGRPLTFRTERAAEKFVASARDLPEGASVIPMNRGGKTEYAVARDMSEADLSAVRSQGESVRVPDGVNTREATILPDADAKLSEAVRGVVAKTQIADGFARRAEAVTSDPMVDTVAAEAMEQPFADDIHLADIEDMEAMVAQFEGDLSPERQAEVEEAKAIQEHFDAYSEVAEAAAFCLGRAA